MVISEEINTIFSDISNKQHDFAKFIDVETFKMPAECYTSMEDYEFKQEAIFKYERTEGIIEGQKDITIDPDYECSFASTLDISDLIPGEIEIEDEIRMGYLWHKYKK